MPRRMICVAALSALAAGLLAPVAARADEKAACFDSAERAQKLRRENKLQKAREEILTCARDVCPAVVRTDCITWLAEVTAALPTVVVSARDPAGHDVIDVKVKVDGEPFLARLGGLPKEIDPGEHKFEYDLPDGEISSETVVIVAGEKNRTVRVLVKPKAPVAPPIVPPPPPPVAPWIVGGVGLAGLGAFGVLQGVAQSQYSDLHGGCGKTKTCDPAAVSSLHTKFVLSGVFLGVGVVGLATGATWLLLAPRKPADKAPPPVALDVAPLPGGALVTFDHPF